MAIIHTSQHHEPWKKEKLIGQKAPLKLKLKDIWGYSDSASTRP